MTSQARLHLLDQSHDRLLREPAKAAAREANRVEQLALLPMADCVFMDAQ